MIVLFVGYFDIHNVRLRFSGTSNTPEVILLSDEDAIVGVLLTAKVTGNRFGIETMFGTLSVHYNGILLLALY